MRNRRTPTKHTPFSPDAPYTCPRCGVGSAAACRCTFPAPALCQPTAEPERPARAAILQPADPEAQAREDADATAPTAEILDAPPLDCASPAVTTPQAQAQVISRWFGTKPPRKLRPAAQDDLFNPNPQIRLSFTGGN
jgi:hypothetical protein